VPKLVGEPSGARECRVAVPGADRLVEELVSYDNAPMSLAYIVAEGMQRVARSVRTTWSVTSLRDSRSELQIDAEVDLSPTGTLVALVAGNAVSSTLSGTALTMASYWWARQFGGVAEPVITGIGASLVVYAVYLAWISGRDVTRRTGRVLSLLDAAWVGATARMLVVAGRGFSVAGLFATVSIAVVVAGPGVSQWRASNRVDRLSRLDRDASVGEALETDGALSSRTF